MKNIRLDLHGSEVYMNSRIWWLQRDVLMPTIHRTQTYQLQKLINKKVNYTSMSGHSNITKIGELEAKFSQLTTGLM